MNDTINTVNKKASGRGQKSSKIKDRSDLSLVFKFFPKIFSIFQSLKNLLKPVLMEHWQVVISPFIPVYKNGSISVLNKIQKLEVLTDV